MALRPCKLVMNAVMEVLLDSEVRQGSRVVEGSQALFEEGFPVRIVQNHQITNRPAEVHLAEDDLWLCIQGRVIFKFGGRLSGPKTLSPRGTTISAPDIIDGEEITMTTGDWFLIPAGQPHQHITPDLAYLVIIKIPTTPVKLEEKSQ